MVSFSHSYLHRRWYERGILRVGKHLGSKSSAILSPLSRLPFDNVAPFGYSRKRYGATAKEESRHCRASSNTCPASGESHLDHMLTYTERSAILCFHAAGKPLTFQKHLPLIVSTVRPSNSIAIAFETSSLPLLAHSRTFHFLFVFPTTFTASPTLCQITELLRDRIRNHTKSYW